MRDAELMARAAVQMARAVEAQGENDMRRLNNEVPTYREGCSCVDHELVEEVDWRNRARTHVAFIDENNSGKIWFNPSCKHETWRKFGGRMHCAKCAKVMG